MSECQPGTEVANSLCLAANMPATSMRACSKKALQIHKHTHIHMRRAIKSVDEIAAWQRQGITKTWTQSLRQTHAHTHARIHMRTHTQMRGWNHQKSGAAMQMTSDSMRKKRTQLVNYTVTHTDTQRCSQNDQDSRAEMSENRAHIHTHTHAHTQ